MRQASAATVVIVCLLIGFAAAPVSAAPPAKTAARAAVDAGIDELRKEYQANQRDPAVTPLRTVCDYFTAKKVPAVPIDAVLTALESKLDGDARAAAYIRWQLLSALPSEVDAAVAARAVEVYRSAALPAPRVGLSAAEQAKLDRLLEGKRNTDDVVFTSELEKAVRVWSQANKYMLAYRDEWYRRLPKNLPTFAAAFRDAFERQNLAAGAEDFSPLVIADVQNWLVTGGADPAKCSQLAELVAQLRAKEAPAYYAFAAVRSGKLTWVKNTDSIDPRKKLTHLHQALVEAAQQPVKKAAK